MSRQTALILAQEAVTVLQQVSGIEIGGRAFIDGIAEAKLVLAKAMTELDGPEELGHEQRRPGA